MIELGNIIKSYREKKDLTLDQVSNDTKIRKYVLKKIEDGEFSDLPQIYGKSFINTYISYLQIPEDEYKDLLNEYLRTQKSEEKVYNPTKFEDYGSVNKGNYSLFGIDLQFNWINYSLYAGATLVVIIILYFSIFDSKPDKVDRIPESNKPEQEIVISDDDLEEQQLQLDSMSLDAFAIDSVWIRIDMDGNVLDEVLLLPNQKASWKAKDYFVVHHGNVGALELKRNGKLLEPFGSPRSVAKNVKITRTEIINPNKY